MNDSIFMKFLEKKSIATENRPVVAQGQKWEQGLTAKKHQENFGSKTQLW